MATAIQEISINDQPLLVVEQESAWAQIRELPLEHKVRGFLGAVGCEFWDADHRFVRENAVSLAGLGGIPAALPGESWEEVTKRIENFVQGSRITMETSASFSYLNSGNQEPGALYDRVTNLGHFSIAHTVTANVLVAGVSINTEVEASTQRDLVHLSRITVGRTAIQTEPAIVAPTQTAFDIARQVYTATRRILDTNRPERLSRDDHELLNNYYPVNKATAFMLSGSLRNLAKLTEQRNDQGKEREYRAVLEKIQATLRPLWPELFD